MLNTEEKLHKFGYGEWIDEPDALEFMHKNIKCRIQRNVSGSLCGYCQLPKDHKFCHIESIFEIPCDVHGGITFSGQFVDSEDHWLGFDCAHGMDISPAIEKELIPIREQFKKNLGDIYKNNGNIFKPTYKNIAFVEKECRNLAEQILKDI